MVGYILFMQTERLTMPAIALPTAVLPPEISNTSNLEDLISSFSSDLDIRKESVRTYVKGIKSFSLFLRERRLKPTRQAVISWREYLKSDHKPTTIKIYLSGLRRFFSWLCSIGNIKEASPCQGVKNIKQTNEYKKDCLTKSQARELLGSIDTTSLAGKRDYAMLALMLATGLRDIEISRAKISDLQTISGQSALAILGKGRDSYEYIKLAPQVERAIRSYLMERGEQNKNAALFASISNRNRNGAAMTTRSISRIVKEHLKAIGLNNDRLTAHSLRHTAATLHLKAGGTLEETQQLLRHKNISTTMIYTHHIEWENRKAESLIANSLFA